MNQKRMEPVSYDVKFSPSAIAAGYASTLGWVFKRRGHDFGGDWLTIERGGVLVTLRGAIGSAWIAQEADSIGKQDKEQ